MLVCFSHRGVAAWGVLLLVATGDVRSSYYALCRYKRKEADKMARLETEGSGPSLNRMSSFGPQGSAPSMTGGRVGSLGPRRR